MTDSSPVLDVIIIGGGISANTAAVYTGRARLSTVVFTGLELDQLSYTSTVENFPGFPDGVLGPDLVSLSKQQAQKFGAQYVQEIVSSVSKKNSGFEIVAGGKSYFSKTVIVATGASARKMNVPGEEKYFGRGVSTCAVCDAAFYSGKSVAVIGGGDSAMEESLALYKFAKKITIVHRRDSFRASKIMQDRVLKLKDKISVVWDSEVLGVLGEKFVTGIKLKNVKTNNETVLNVDGVFLAVGHIPNTSFLNGLLELDTHGYIKVTGVKTSVQGIFACGDVMDPYFRQAVTSAGTGCMAAIEAEKVIEQLNARDSS